MELKCSKRCWAMLAVVVGVVLVGAAVYYFVFIYQAPKLTYADIDILCENLDLSDEAATADREAKLQLIYDSPGFTAKELEAMLPENCRRVKRTIPEPGACLVLEQEYCEKLLAIDYQGISALGVNLPGGVPIFAPADGAYFDNYTGEKIVEDGEELTVLPTRAEFWLVNTNSTVIGSVSTSTSYLYFDGVFSDSTREDGRSVSKGDILIYTAPAIRYLDEETQSNFVIIYSNPDMYKLVIPQSLTAED